MIVAASLEETCVALCRLVLRCATTRTALCVECIVYVASCIVERIDTMSYIIRARFYRTLTPRTFVYY